MCLRAELEYQAARLVRRRDAKGRLVLGVAGQEVEIVSERGQGGTVGAVGGSGEREAVKRRAALRHDVARVRRELVEVRRRRERQRARRALEGHRTVALVGYTNAGKSSLMAALCGVVRACACVLSSLNRNCAICPSLFKGWCNFVTARRARRGACAH